MSKAYYKLFCEIFSNFVTQLARIHKEFLLNLIFFIFKMDKIKSALKSTKPQTIKSETDLRRNESVVEIVEPQKSAAELSISLGSKV